MARPDPDIVAENSQRAGLLVQRRPDLRARLIRETERYANTGQPLSTKIERLLYPEENRA